MSTGFETDQVLYHAGHEFRVRSLPGLDGQPPLVCIGGAFQNIDSWTQTADWFQPERALLLVDLPGMGDSPLLSNEFDIEFLCESLDNCLQEFGVETASVLAASYGSLIAYRFAQLYPHRIAHLILVGIMAELDQAQVAWARQHIARIQSDPTYEFSDEIVSLLISEHMLKTRRGRVIARMLRKRLDALTGDNVRKYVSNTSRIIEHEPLNISQPPLVPTLVFTGEHDHLTPPRAGRECAETIPGAWFTTIRDADHLCHLQQFDSCVNLVSKFLNDETLFGSKGCNEITRF